MGTDDNNQDERTEGGERETDHPKAGPTVSSNSNETFKRVEQPESTAYRQQIAEKDAEIARLKSYSENRDKEVEYYQRQLMRENESMREPSPLDRIYYNACAKVFGNEFPHSMRMKKEAFEKAMRMAQMYKPW